MKLRSWPINLIGLLFLMFAFVPAQAQKSDSIRIAPDINKEIVPIALNDKVNSNYEEVGPLTSSNGKRLYYSRHGHPSNTGGAEDTDIWYNEFNDSTQTWSESINIGAPLNNKGPNFVCEVGWTDDTLVVANEYKKIGAMTAGLSLSTWDGKAWAFPKPIHVKNDYNIAENVGYDLSSYRNVLVIAEQKVDAYGKTDLYVAFRDHSGKRKTTESFNLGGVINSTGSERSPFLTDDTKTLYFASDGHKGYGKLDIFRSHRLDDTWTNWSKPENLGPEINTPFDDRSFAFGSTSRYAYYSRGVTDTRSDIYLVRMALLFSQDASAISNLATRTTATEPGQILTLSDAFVDEQATLTESARSELKNMVAYMQRLKNLTVFFGTHSNVHDKRLQSITLSDKRLAEVKQYLIANGIDKNRIKGESDGHDVVKVAIRKNLGNSLEFKFINRVVIHPEQMKGK